MLRNLARRVFYLLVGLAVIGGMLYAAGLRIVQYGGGGIQFAFMKSLDQRAAEIETHREAQRAQAPPVPPIPRGAAPSAQPTAEKSSPATVRASTYWTSFRGPDRDGHYRQRPVRTEWGRALAPLWKQPVGGGFASFVIADGLAFTLEQRGDRELAAACDFATGLERWTTAWNALFQENGVGPRATPAWHDGRLYVLRQADSRLHGDAAGRSLATERTAALGVAMADGESSVAAAHDRARSRVRFQRLRHGCGDAPGCARRRRAAHRARALANDPDEQ